MNWLDQTHKMYVRARKEMTLREIHEKAGVKYEWLNSFAQRKAPNPGINTVQKLHDYLAKRERAAHARTVRANRKKMQGEAS